MMLRAIPARGRARGAGRGWVARRERAVDPLEGPLQAFAYDLRKVRADAGNLTYPALAKVAGYSATTLSEAAGAARKPTLDVVLAYVGACRGDCVYWRSRWEDLPEPPPLPSGSGAADSPTDVQPTDVQPTDVLPADVLPADVLPADDASRAAGSANHDLPAGRAFPAA